MSIIGREMMNVIKPTGLAARRRSRRGRANGQTTSSQAPECLAGPRMLGRHLLYLQAKSTHTCMLSPNEIGDFQYLCCCCHFFKNAVAHGHYPLPLHVRLQLAFRAKHRA
jgi:hypothetical protein